MTAIECRRAMHEAERSARNMQDGNPFALVRAEALIESAEHAYFETREALVAKRLHVAIDRMSAFA